jgi:hypothetical protein
MQINANAVFAEINLAYYQDKSGLELSPDNITYFASERIQTMWATSHFKCAKAGKCIEDIVKMYSSNNYQVRNIPIFSEQGKSQDMVIEFAADGKISDMYIAAHQITTIMDNLNVVTDLRQKETLLKTLDHFRTAYNCKDIDFLEDIYSEDALIITGMVKYFERKQIKTDTPITTTYSNKGTRVEYSVQNKKEYIAKMRRIFAANSYINIKFENIVITQHGGNPNIYGVTLRQKWNTSTYSDDGWLFLIFDYEDENKPQIWVRTWQPLTRKNPITGKEEEIHYSAAGINGTEKIFGLDDFKFR